MSGMVPRNPGTIGTYLRDVLCRNLECRHLIGTVHPTNVLLSGREGYPNIRTVDHWLGGDRTERYPQSRYAGNNDHHGESDMILIA